MKQSRKQFIQAGSLGFFSLLASSDLFALDNDPGEVMACNKNRL